MIKRLFKLSLLLTIASNCYGEGLNLNWKDLSNNETGFEIERRLYSIDQDNAWETIFTTGEDVQTYNDLEPENNKSTIYEYRVRAVNVVNLDWMIEPRTYSSGYTNTAWYSVNMGQTPNSPSFLTIPIDTLTINANTVIINEN